MSLRALFKHCLILYNSGILYQMYESKYVIIIKNVIIIYLNFSTRQDCIMGENKLHISYKANNNPIKQNISCKALTESAMRA